MGEKFRVDSLLVNKGLLISRERAKLAIEQQLVFADGKCVQKPSDRIDDTAVITLLRQPLQYVGRGGLKIEKALKEFQLEVIGKTCIDIGASTGGFTDCLLQNGAARVYAVDVGQNQLADALRQDSRVIPMENTDIRKLDLSVFGDDISFICIDVSFISLTLLFPVLQQLANNACEIVCLVKPQFEAGRGHTNKNGVVTSSATHRTVLDHILRSAASHGLQAAGLTFSPITGQSGNIEYLLYLRKNTPSAVIELGQIIRNAFENTRSKDGDKH